MFRDNVSADCLVSVGTFQQLKQRKARRQKQRVHKQADSQFQPAHTAEEDAELTQLESKVPI